MTFGPTQKKKKKLVYKNICIQTFKLVVQEYKERKWNGNFGRDS